MIQKKSDFEFQYPYIKNIFNDDPNLSELVKFIMNNQQYKPFCQVLKLLSFESHTNIDIYINRYVKKNFICAFRMNDKIIKYTDDIRYNIISFELLLLALENETNVKNSGTIFTPSTGYLGTSSLSSTTGSTSGYDKIQEAIGKRPHELDGLNGKFENIYYCIIQFYEELYLIHQQFKTKYINLLLPSLIYFRSTDQLDEYIFSSNFVVLRQILLVTVVALELALLEHYDWPQYSIHMYTSYLKNNGTTSKRPMLDPSRRMRFTSSDLENLYHDNLHDVLFQANDTELQFY